MNAIHYDTLASSESHNNSSDTIHRHPQTPTTTQAWKAYDATELVGNKTYEVCAVDDMMPHLTRTGEGHTPHTYIIIYAITFI